MNTRRTWKLVRWEQGTFGRYEVWSTDYGQTRKVLLRRPYDAEPTLIWTDDPHVESG